mmetsp:Transcript_24381/g.45097  ORF Transcript_24381/g.45097 Transcript_24381/m.45097 type:complete len:80 (-) Transcript_24381:282-521(-)
MKDWAEDVVSKENEGDVDDREAAPEEAQKEKTTAAAKLGNSDPTATVPVLEPPLPCAGNMDCTALLCAEAELRKWRETA